MRATISTRPPNRRGRAQVVFETRGRRSRTDVQCNAPEPKTPEFPCDVCGRATHMPDADVWLCSICSARVRRRRKAKP
jgi:ribosomal protein L37AE/L43A